MKLFFLVLGLFSINFCSHSQELKVKDLSGVWQSESNEIASAWLDVYQFFPDCSFVFNLNQYDEARRVVSINGHYRINADTIFFTVEKTIELQGGYFERNLLTTIHGSWALTGDVIQKEIIQPKKEEQYAIIKPCIDKNLLTCLMFDRINYFKISSKPEEYK